MKEPHRKGLTIRRAPSRAPGTRKGPGEASVGVHMSRVLSCEIQDHEGAQSVAWDEGNTGRIATGKRRSGPSAVGDPVRVWKLLGSEPGGPVDGR